MKDFIFGKSVIITGFKNLIYLISIMDIDMVRSEITCMMDTLQHQLDYLDDIFEREQERIRIEKQENCFCKFYRQLFYKEKSL